MSLYETGREYTPQSFVASVQLRIDGEEQSMIPPQNLISAEIEMLADGLGMKASLTLFDRRYLELESKLLHSEKGEVDIRWGYTDGLISDWFYGKLIKVVPTYQRGGAQLDIELLANSFEKGHDTPKYKAYYDKDLEQIVKEVCERNGWQYEIEKPQQRKDNDSMTETLPINKLILQNNVTDLQFLKSLTSYAITQDGRGGYVARFEPKEKKFYFKAPDYDRDCVRWFYIGMDKNTEVRSFSPRVEHTWMGKMGGDMVRGLTLDSLSKKIVEKVVHNYNTPEKIVMGGWTIAYDPKEQVKKTLDEVYSSGELCEAITKNSFYNFEAGFIQAELVIQGDHRLRPGDNVAVICFTDPIREEGGFESKYLYLSSKYMIKELKHSIRAGDYETTMSLASQGVLVPPEGSCKFKRVPSKVSTS